MGRARMILVGYALLVAGMAAGMATVAGERATWVPAGPGDLARLQTALHTEGVTYAFVDAARNQVVFGVRTREARERVERAMRRMRLAPGVVRFEPESGLLSEARPLEGCQLQAPPRPDPGAIRLALSQETAHPGAHLAFTIVGVEPERVTRGVDAYLECWDGQAWSPRFILITDGHGGPSALVYGPVAIPGLGLAGPGPEAVRLPRELQPGWYRLRKRFAVTSGGQVESPTAFAYLQVARDATP